MSLREELAIHWRRRFHYCGTCAEDTSPPDKYWLSMADECIRQMEWARRFCPDNQTFLGPLSGEQMPIVGRTLTLAPEDWKPE